MTTTTKTSARVMATDEATGKRYVKTQTIEGAAVTVTRFTGVMTGDKYSWSSATYDVTSPAGELFAGARSSGTARASRWAPSPRPA